MTAVGKSSGDGIGVVSVCLLVLSTSIDERFWRRKFLGSRSLFKRSGLEVITGVIRWRLKAGCCFCVVCVERWEVTRFAIKLLCENGTVV